MDLNNYSVYANHIDRRAEMQDAKVYPLDITQLMGDHVICREQKSRVFSVNLEGEEGCLSRLDWLEDRHILPV